MVMAVSEWPPARRQRAAGSAAAALHGGGGRGEELMAAGARLRGGARAIHIHCASSRRRPTHTSLVSFLRPVPYLQRARVKQICVHLISLQITFSLFDEKFPARKCVFQKKKRKNLFFFYPLELCWLRWESDAMRSSVGRLRSRKPD